MERSTGRFQRTTMHHSCKRVQRWSWDAQMPRLNHTKFKSLRTFHLLISQDLNPFKASCHLNSSKFRLFFVACGTRSKCRCLSSPSWTPSRSRLGIGTTPKLRHLWATASGSCYGCGLTGSDPIWHLDWEAQAMLLEDAGKGGKPRLPEQICDSPCQYCPKTVIDKNIYHTAVKTQQLEAGTFCSLKL